jgi:hypothetical protein
MEPISANSVTKSCSLFTIDAKIECRRLLVLKGRHMLIKAAKALVLLFVLPALAACEGATPNLIVQSVIPSNKDCTYQVDSTLELSKGYYDAFCGKPYSIFVRVISLMRTRADINRPRSEPNVVQFTSAEVQLETLAGSAIGDKFSTPVFATVSPGDTSKPGKVLVQIEIIPQALIKSVQKHKNNETLTATVKLFGTTASGTDVESDEFAFPFDVCDGCLTMETAGENCTLSDDQKQALESLTTCQNRQGYDGSFCLSCNGTAL